MHEQQLQFTSMTFLFLVSLLVARPLAACTPVIYAHFEPLQVCYWASRWLCTCRAFKQSCIVSWAGTASQPSGFCRDYARCTFHNASCPCIPAQRCRWSR